MGVKRPTDKEKEERDPQGVTAQKQTTEESSEGIENVR